MNNKKYFAPLFEFSSDIEEFRFKSYLRIKNKSYIITDRDRESHLSNFDIDEIHRCNYCIEITNPPNSYSISVLLNTLLLAFWIYNPNKLQVRYQFGHRGHFVRMLDQFHHNPIEKLVENYTYDDLSIVKIYFNKILRITRTNGRLYTALVCNFLGCISFTWRPAYLLFSSALEAILTYSSYRGITSRLAKSYACTVSEKKIKRDSLYKQFYAVYNVRSELIHGSLRKFARSKSNLKRLSEISNMLRNLWKAVLENNKLMAILEKSDSKRKEYINIIEQGYSVPIINKNS